MSREGNFRKMLCDCRGSQLVELAIGIPVLLVIAIGVSQFGAAFNLKQILNNAAREGARVAANENSDFGDLNNCANGSCVSAIAQVVSNYLQNEGVTPQCTFNTTGSSAGSFAWSFSATGNGCGGVLLTVERIVSVTNGSDTVVCSRVTLTYPYTWLPAMAGALSLLPGPAPTLPTSLTSNAIMPNIN